MGMTLLLGGARSGKSTLAVRIARAWEEPVAFVATAVAGDADMATRIARHREERPASWACVEEPLDLGGALAREPGAAVVVDCLTVWVANLLERGSASEAIAEAERVASLSAARDRPTVVVSNEVGLGVHPATRAGREFRDVLGRVNAIWAAAADDVRLLIAGRELELHPVRLPGGETDA
jgi:adenosylcobinamide kinase / adenosylcobinamide-phosphate guanylyltransferase